MTPIISACLLLVTADTHSARFVPNLFDVMYSYSDPSTVLLDLGDFVDGPDGWDDDWVEKISEYDIFGVPGNHDDREGYLRHVGDLPRIVCGDPDEPEFVAFGIDSERVLGSHGRGLEWARDRYPYTPWVVLTHRPLASCLDGHRGLDSTRWGRALEAELPPGSIVVAGHQHVWCLSHEEGWTQVVVSTGGGKRYHCGESLSDNVLCEYLPDYPTFVYLDPVGDVLKVVGLTDGGVTERTMSILESEGFVD